MVDRKMKEKGHANTSIDLNREHKDMRFICPVCKKPLHEDNLVDMKSIVKDNLYYVGGIRIMNSRVPIACDFQHRLDKGGVTLDEPHELVAVVTAEFDGSGACIQFEIAEVLAG
ncbi:MAG: hypothetical protein AYK19_19490 [Theionarchaea archaeon DG-70-1]|nr:MAG: hypothetical protein AYK19_19490 [Theionarchaea archaeon DG-70-1]